MQAQPDAPALLPPLIVCAPAEPHPTPCRRRQNALPVDPARLTGRIIAATRKAERLERTGLARDTSQARAIRRRIEQIARQQAQAAVQQQARGYTAEECDQWLVAHEAARAKQHGQGAVGASTPPLTGSTEGGLPAFDAVALIARVRARQQATGIPAGEPLG